MSRTESASTGLISILAANRCCFFSIALMFAAVVAKLRLGIRLIKFKSVVDDGGAPVAEFAGESLLSVSFDETADFPAAIRRG